MTIQTPLLTRAQVRELDRRAIEEYGVPGVVLMENAGRAVAEHLFRLGTQGPVFICCGKGNNGGDGFVIARHLDNGGVPVRVYLFASPQELSGDAAVNFNILAHAHLDVVVQPQLNDFREALRGADWIVDALFGTGLSGPVRAPMDQVIAAVNGSGAHVLAVDLPSGLDCDTGQALGATVRADQTVTFVALKRGFAQPEARPWLGQVHVAGIGVPRCLVQAMLSLPPGP